jgi:hypothetical protein
MIFIFAMGIVVAIVVGLLLLFVAGCCCHCWLVKSIFRKIQTMANANEWPMANGQWTTGSTFKII